MKKHRTHLPTRFLMTTPEENLVAAIIKQTWCDAFMKETHGYVGTHNKNEKKRALQMFESDTSDEWRKSLGYLAGAVQIEDEDLVQGYSRYKKALEKGIATVEPDEAFDILLKTLVC